VVTIVVTALLRYPNLDPFIVGLLVADLVVSLLFLPRRSALVAPAPPVPSVPNI